MKEWNHEKIVTVIISTLLVIFALTTAISGLFIYNCGGYTIFPPKSYPNGAINAVGCSPGSGIFSFLNRFGDFSSGMVLSYLFKLPYALDRIFNLLFSVVALSLLYCLVRRKKLLVIPVLLIILSVIIMIGAVYLYLFIYAPTINKLAVAVLAILMFIVSLFSLIYLKRYSK